MTHSWYWSLSEAQWRNFCPGLDLLLPQQTHTASTRNIRPATIRTLQFAAPRVVLTLFQSYDLTSSSLDLLVCVLHLQLSWVWWGTHGWSLHEASEASSTIFSGSVLSLKHQTNHRQRRPERGAAGSRSSSPCSCEMFCLSAVLRNHEQAGEDEVFLLNNLLDALNQPDVYLFRGERAEICSSLCHLNYQLHIRTASLHNSKCVRWGSSWICLDRKSVV